MDSKSYHIAVNFFQRYIYLYQGYNLLNSYPIGIGRAATPAPVGEYLVTKKNINPPLATFGTRSIHLSNTTTCIHGTNNPSSIGRSVSDGCISMHNKDIEELFELVEIGTRVIIFLD